MTPGGQLKGELRYAHNDPGFHAEDTLIFGEGFRLFSAVLDELY